jgi:hypothetical protein
VGVLTCCCKFCFQVIHGVVCLGAIFALPNIVVDVMLEGGGTEGSFFGEIATIVHLCEHVQNSSCYDEVTMVERCFFHVGFYCCKSAMRKGKV